MTDELQEKEAVPKKRINSKKKGVEFESTISKLLGEHLAPMKFRRSQSSGAILGGLNEKIIDHFSKDAKTLFIGDVVPSNEADVIRDQGWKLKFTVECKFYKSSDHIEHLVSGSTQIRGWFEQATADAEKLQKHPLLIFKFNHTDIFVAVNALTIDRLPTSISRSAVFSWGAENVKKKDWPPRTIHVFYLKEALLDLDWWKEVVSNS